MVSPWALPVIVKPSLCRPRSIVTAAAASAADTISTPISASSGAAFRPAEVAASVSVSVPPRPRHRPPAMKPTMVSAPQPGVDDVRADEPVIVSPWALPVIVKPSLCRPRSMVTPAAASAADTASTPVSAPSSAAFRPAEVAASVSVSVPPPPSTSSPVVNPTMVSAPSPASMTSRRRRPGDGVALGAAGDREAVALQAEVDRHGRPRQRRRHRLDLDQLVVRRRVEIRRGRRNVSVRPAPPSTSSPANRDVSRRPGVDVSAPPP